MLIHLAYFMALPIQNANMDHHQMPLSKGKERSLLLMPPPPRDGILLISLLIPEHRLCTDSPV